MSKTILIVTANPDNTERIRFDKEVRDIDEGLKRKWKSSYKIISIFAARPKDIRRAILDHQPSFVHFSGHGEGEEGIVFEDESGNQRTVDSNTLAEFFSLFVNDISCIVLNACYSEVQAKEIAKYIPYVIGMQKEIEDKSAIAFSVAFYDGIFAGLTIEKSHKLASNAIKWEDTELENTPQPTLVRGELRGNLLLAEKIKPPQKNKKNISQKTQQAKSNRNTIDIYTENLFEVMSKFELLIKTEIKRTKDKKIIDSLKDLMNKTEKTRLDLENQSFKVAIIALAKSGKSSLLNAWLGNEYLPSSNVPETANIIRIKHNIKQKKGALTHRNSSPIVGANQIRAYIEKLNKQTRDQKKDPIREEIILEAPIQTLSNTSFDRFKFEILDTPGPNEYGQEKLKLAVDEVLDKSAVIIYLLDYTKLKTDEENNILEKLRSMRKNLIEDFSDRLFFVINKIDQFDRNSLPIEEIPFYVSKLLESQIEGLRIPPQRVLLVSAKDALLSRIIQNDESTQEQRLDFARVMFGLSYKEKAINSERLKKYAKGLEETSRIAELEEKILEFIYSQRRRLLLLGAADEIDRNLLVFDNYLATIIGTLNADQEKLQNEIHILEKKIDNLIKNIKDIREKVSNYKKKADIETESLISNFRLDTHKIIVTAFKGAENAEMTFLSVSIPSGIKRLMQQVRLEFKSFSVKNKDKEIVVASLSNINAHISKLLEFTYDELTSNIQSVLYKLQINLTEELRKELIPLTKEIEKEIEETLSISLHPININLNFPERKDFLGKLIQESESIITSTRVSSFKVKPKLAWGWLPWIDIQFFEDEYEVSSDEYQKRFREQLEKIGGLWQEIVKNHINNEFNPILNVVQNKLDEYSKTYISTIKDNIVTDQKKENNRKAKLELIKQVAQEQNNLISTINVIRKFLKES